jgi:glycosyltransferase involved in cell wall biosynthesis
MKLSIISPVYGASTLLEELVERISIAANKITPDFEIILVEDHSPDNSWEIIKKIASTNKNVNGIKLSRNFGQQNALNAGFDYATGDWIITMDCDLQDEPEQFQVLFNKTLEGFDIVFASRQNRQDGLLKKLFSVLFYKVLSYLTETKIDHSVANFILYNKKCIDAMSKIGDYYRYYPLLNNWIGFNTTKVQISHAKRKDNITSSYSFKKRLRLAYQTIIAFSDKPLRIVLKIGISLVSFSLIIAAYLVINYIISDQKVSGWLSVFLSIWFLSGIIIFTLGLIGVYLGKIFDTTKNRPTYLIENVYKNEN